MISRFHRAGQHRIHLQSEQSCANKKQRNDDNYNHQNGGYHIPDFLYRSIHIFTNSRRLFIKKRIMG